MKNLATPPAEVVHEHKVTTENNDELECGVLRINDTRTPLAYASLGETTVCIFRDPSGNVRIEIDDIAKEAVRISVNTVTLAVGAEALPDIPWHG